MICLQKVFNLSHIVLFQISTVSVIPLLLLKQYKVAGNFIIGVNSQFITIKNSFIQRSQFFMNDLSKNSYTMYSDCLAVYRVQTVDDNYNYSL